ncbi:MAG TPA: aminotransferase class I/II-fold pyridoxal phosphate-dependent enzyme [Syntrophales bacterium]|nr:aminotransferase class I/II-fold pyridoxal phosphate-dependent enzyme [Syntrophales bacterium]HOL59893.1 aminotransferase class I/II-fold pyridoxal phosphate-dependent enzyme [Syntrophales bacterium]HPO36040.1 aminotransferase class I/II-fold pyridoxal phosphate-dependent enzyme [Syntrophales bacterium]
MDIFEKCYHFTAARDAIAAGLYPYFIPLTENEGTVASFKGHRLIMCGSNNYLGLTTDPRVREAAMEAIRRFGTSCTGSRFLNGTLELHLQLEEELAAWVGKEAALVFSTGMQTNLGTISALVGRHDIVILDKDDHASIVDGARLGWGTIKRFRHSDMKDLERVLGETSNNRGLLVAVDGLYSMGGDIAPLPEIVRLSKRFGARIMVDDAHALGVLGNGRGTAAHFGLTHEVDLIMSTFSKSLASLGGFIAGDEAVIHYIKHNARALIFSASIPPANAAAALAALRILKSEPERVERLNHIGDYMRRELRRLGFNIGQSASPIIPIIIGDDTLTLMATKALFDEGVFVNAVLSPAVPPGQQLLRTSYMATHTDEQLAFCLEAYERVGKNLGII